MLELFLLNVGIRPEFYESGYNRYFEEAVFANDSLKDFAPEIVYLHTTVSNVSRYPLVAESAEEIETLIANEVKRFSRIWDKITSDYSCSIIQNNFDLPHFRAFGNLDGYDVHGRTHFISELNRRFADEARQRSNLYLNDINYLSAWFGLESWHDRQAWYSYKYAMSIQAIPMLAHSIASIINAITGRSRKCLVLDLDNTLWGGVIGDDGLGGIRIGKETPISEAYTEFQQYVVALKDRGVILAVCSKNDEVNAREGFSHPDSVLALKDFSDFRANWEPKHENIREVAKYINIGIDSLVFADDNPVERDIVRAQEPQVAVPELGNNVAKYIDVLDKSGLFEAISLSSDDLQRSSYYSANAARESIQASYENYGDFLCSLKMTAEIKLVTPVYIERVTQLINKTNQFNVTTQRYTQAEVDIIAADSRYIPLYGRLQDKFGDNGLISVMIGMIQGDKLILDVWLMSCRVLKRGMEAAMLDQMVAVAHSREIKSIIGYYYPTAKNSMVSNLFEDMGFQQLTMHESKATSWELNIEEYVPKNIFIEVCK
jgi:FkbH-like protein